MKKLNFIKALVAIAAFAVLPLGQSALAQDKPLVIGTDIEAKPFDFSENGKYVGFDQDVFAEIAKELGRSYTVRAMDFGALIPALQTSNIDVGLSCIFITDARKKVVDFSDPYYNSALGVLIRADEKEIKSGADLNGKPVAVMTGAAGATWVRGNVKGSEPTLFPQIANMFLELQTGRVRALVHDYPYFAYYTANEGKGKARLLAEPVGEAIPCGIAYPKGSPLVKPTNDALKKIRADGRYNKIYQKWFGKLP